MSTQITVPDFWMLFDPQGIATDSITASTSTRVLPTAQAALGEYEPNARKRDRLAQLGYRMLPVETSDWNDFWFGKRRHPGLDEARA